MKSKHYWSSGQSLVEVTVASVALIFGLIAVISGVILAVRNSSVSSRQSLATQNAQEVIEVFRKYQRALGWETFYDTIADDTDGNTATYCVIELPANENDFESLESGNCTVSANDTSSVREAQISVISDTEIEVSSVVTWRDGNTTRSATAKNVFRQFN